MAVAGMIPGAVGLASFRSGSSWLACTTRALVVLGKSAPQLLIGIDRRAPSDGLARGCRLGLSVLAGQHSAIAEDYARPHAVGGACDDPWVPAPDGEPLLKDAAATLSCVVRDVFDGGSQMLVTASVRALGIERSHSALMTWQGDYDRIGWSAEEIARATGCAA